MVIVKKTIWFLSGDSEGDYEVPLERKHNKEDGNWHSQIEDML